MSDLPEATEFPSGRRGAELFCNSASAMQMRPELLGELVKTARTVDDVGELDRSGDGHAFFLLLRM